MTFYFRVAREIIPRGFGGIRTTTHDPKGNE